MSQKRGFDQSWEDVPSPPTLQYTTLKGLDELDVLLQKVQEETSRKKFKSNSWEDVISPPLQYATLEDFDQLDFLLQQVQ